MVGLGGVLMRMVLINELQLNLLKEKAKENSFFKSLFDYYNKFGRVSEKQFSFIKELEKNYLNNLNKNKKLNEF